MKYKTKILVRRIVLGLLIVAIGGSVQNCARVVDEPVPAQASTIGDVIDDELMTVFETIPSSNYKLENLVLPDGELVVDFLRKNNPAFLDKQLKGGRQAALGPQESKKMLLSQMTTVAYKLCDRSIKHTRGSTFIEPEHFGLAYSWGQRNYLTRAFPPASDAHCTMYSVYGLDCSGFVYNVLKESNYDPGLPIDVDRIVKKDMSFWISLFKKDADLAQVKVKDLGTISSSQLQPGDFVYWFDTKKLRKQSIKDPSHIGVVLVDKSGQKAIFQSNGRNVSDVEVCKSNFESTGRGCRQIPINQVATTNYGTYAGVIRLVVDITGKWEMQLKCDWAAPTEIAAKLTIEFKMSENDDAVTGKGSGYDYDGTPMTVEFKGSFDQPRNVLKGRFYLSFPDGGVRQDDLNATLKDDTGFIPLTSVVRGSNTCEGQVRLINRTTSGGRQAAIETVSLTRQNLF